MAIIDLLNDKRFNIFFSFIVGLGIVCMFKPSCSDSSCSVIKPPQDKDFDKYVYKMGGGKCYEFKSELVDCPSSGTIEAFKECNSKTTNEYFNDQFSRRSTVIQRCE